MYEPCGCPLCAPKTSRALPDGFRLPSLRGVRARPWPRDRQTWEDIGEHDPKYDVFEDWDGLF